MYLRACLTIPCLFFFFGLGTLGQSKQLSQVQFLLKSTFQTTQATSSISTNRFLDRRDTALFRKEAQINSKGWTNFGPKGSAEFQDSKRTVEGVGRKANTVSVKNLDTFYLFIVWVSTVQSLRVSYIAMAWKKPGLQQTEACRWSLALLWVFTGRMKQKMNTVYNIEYCVRWKNGSTF